MKGPQMRIPTRIRFLGLLVLIGCSDPTASPNRPAHLEPPPVPPKIVTRDPAVKRFSIPSDWTPKTPLVTLPSVTPEETIVVRWRPPDPDDGTPLKALPSVVFAIMRIRPGQRDLNMTTNVSKGRLSQSDADACEAQLEAPKEPGTYRVRVRLGREIFSEAVLVVEPAKTK
jgi:hypothetical protein